MVWPLQRFTADGTPAFRLERIFFDGVNRNVEELSFGTAWGAEAETAEAVCAAEVEAIAKAQIATGTTNDIKATIFRVGWSSLLRFKVFLLTVYSDSAR
jgi:hypothetical protein